MPTRIVASPLSLLSSRLGPWSSEHLHSPGPSANVLVQRTTVHWGPDNDNVEECFEHVADGDAACICPTSMIAFYRRPDIAWIPITEPGWV